MGVDLSEGRRLGGEWSEGAALLEGVDLSEGQFYLTWRGEGKHGPAVDKWLMLN